MDPYTNYMALLLSAKIPQGYKHLTPNGVKTSTLLLLVAQAPDLIRAVISDQHRTIR